MSDSITLTIQSLNAYGPLHDHWAIAWSGGKDSTTLVTLTMHLIETGQVQPPKSLTVMYADTRMELPPLSLAAQEIIRGLRERNINVRHVMASMDKRFFVYILGRGVPPPNNNTFRWCTRQIKVEPMHDELRRLFGEAGTKVLVLTGVRQGESAMRDGRIAMSCGRNGAECGQGWYQETLPGSLCNTLAPLLHWRVCHIWDWLKFFAPNSEYGAWKTADIADDYGGEEAEEINTRTGCLGCPLAERDVALDAVLRNPKWAHLRPLKELRSIYRALREPRNRLRKTEFEYRKDGMPSPNPNRMGPLTMEARRWALAKILAIQEECGSGVDILNAEEVARIEELIANNTWPRKWTGEERTGDMPFDALLPDGVVMPRLFS